MEFYCSYKNHISSYRGKFQWIFGQVKEHLIWVGGEFELSELELSQLTE